MNICLIPARGGSRRIPLKNIKPFFGKPIILYSIEAAIATGLFSKIIISTDDDEIAKVCRDAFPQVTILSRSADMCRDEVGTWMVTLDAVNILDLDDDDKVCTLYATSPMVDPSDIKVGCMFLETLDLAHAISVGYPPLQDAGQFYWSQVEAMRNGIDYFTVATGLVRISKNRVCDINTQDDWDRAEEMYINLNGRMQ